MRAVLSCFWIIVVFVFSCTIKPEPIQYNHDECAYCKMKISDARFGAELVTSKGKIYKYDSAECLLRTHIENSDPDYAYILVTDFSNPHNLIDAQSASFLISPAQPSPMGGNLSAYEDERAANKTKTKKGGDLYDFNQLLQQYKQQYQ